MSGQSDILARAGSAAKAVEGFVPPVPGTPEHLVWLTRALQLLECPFCGATPRTHDDLTAVVCLCGCTLLRWKGEKLADFKRRWNRPSERTGAMSRAIREASDTARSLANRAEYEGNGFG